MNLSRRRFAASAAAFAVAAPLAGCGRSADPGVAAHETPQLDFGEAKRRARAAIAADLADPAIAPDAVPRLLVHDRRTERAIVLLHGFTNCPKQFDALARRLYDRGCNVFVPRLPRHGYKDRLTFALSDLSTSELQQSAAAALDVARGLGASVTAMGLSLGGEMALWLAQARSVDLAIPVAPFLAPLPLGEKTGSLVASLLYSLPSFYQWWDARIKERCLPAYAYPGYPTHALAELIFFGAAIFAAAKAGKPRARRCILVTNAGDNAVNNATSRDLLATWNASGAGYREFVFENLGPPHHDIVDPTTFPQGRTLVYPVLERLALSS